MRLIDAESVTMDILSTGKIGKLTCIDLIKHSKTIDVTPVAHGQWRPIGKNKANRPDCFECTVCHKCEPYVSNYCPNCGAKLDMKISNEIGR